MAASALIFLGPILVSVAFLSTGSWVLFADDPPSLQAIEKEMAERPQEAVAIALRAADRFADADDRRQLFNLAARLQEEQLRNLSEAHVMELAKVYENTLGDSKAGLRVRLAWLRQRAMTQEEVLHLIGQPKRVSCQILYRHQIEQWAYQDPMQLRIEFDCVKGQNPRLLGIHTVTSKER